LPRQDSEPKFGLRWRNGPNDWWIAVWRDGDRDKRIFARDLLDTLTRRELADTATQIASQTGLAFRPVEEGDHVSGIYRRRIDLASGRFALIEDGYQFLLVPWRPIVDRQLGREVSGVLRGGSMPWNLRRERGLGI